MNRLVLHILAALLLSAQVVAADMVELEAASDKWWGLWLPAETADLDMAGILEGDAVGFGFFGKSLRKIDDVDAWKQRMRAWLDTLEKLEYGHIDRQLDIVGGTGLEWGLYHERQILKGGEVRRAHKGRYTITWVNTPSGWRIASYHRSAIPE